MSQVTSTSTKGSRTLGLAAAAGMAWLVVMGLFVSPRDQLQKDWVRLLYVHVGSVVWSYAAFGITAFCSAMYLWRRTRSMTWDRIAGASAEVGLLLIIITLFTGALWGKGTWGVYWTWEARTTTTALLAVLYCGYLALRRVDGDPQVRAKRTAIAGLIAFLDVPIVHKSVDWWRTLHQGRTIKPNDTEMDGLMLFTVFVGVIAFGLFYAWLMMHRLRTASMEELIEQRSLDEAIAERVAEGAAR